ncbi:hypothetical protein, partial [uncultured Paraglaciecola sp.]|uniref:hypothetical protein n=1 Tax=uncultured Paraglaciecola sp. TaxID=1765024 RepID=UPI0030D6E9B4
RTWLRPATRSTWLVSSILFKQKVAYLRNTASFEAVFLWVNIKKVTSATKKGTENSTPITFTSALL